MEEQDDNSSKCRIHSTKELDINSHGKNISRDGLCNVKNLFKVY